MSRLMSTFMPHAHCTNSLLTNICQDPWSATCKFRFFSCCLLCPILINSNGFGVVNLSSCIASELQRFQPQSQSSTDPLPHYSALGLSQIPLLSGSSALSAALVTSNTTQIPIMQIPNRPPLNELAENRTKNVLQTHLFSLPFCPCLLL